MFLFLLLAGSLRKWLAYSLLIRSKGETHRNKHFSTQNNAVSSTFLIRLTLQGYRCNQTFQSLNKGSLEIKRVRVHCTVPFYMLIIKLQVKQFALDQHIWRLSITQVPIVGGGRETKSWNRLIYFQLKEGTLGTFDLNKSNADSLSVSIFVNVQCDQLSWTEDVFQT